MNITDAIKSVTTGMPTLITGGQPGYRAGNQKLAWNKPELAGSNIISVQSEAFENGSAIPFKYSADGLGISPPLSWSNLPQGTQSVAVVVEDPDAPTPEPFVHWLVYNVPAGINAIPENVGHDATISEIGSAMQGKNSSLKIGWAGMAPPKGDTLHHYHFQVFALDRTLDLKPKAGRTELFNAMAGHVIGRGEIVGTYQRQPAISQPVNTQ
jgi:Raf kinase inhibitor-like YbhB/YbcL family protein